MNLHISRPLFGLLVLLSISVSCAKIEAENVIAEPETIEDSEILEFKSLPEGFQPTNTDYLVKVTKVETYDTVEEFKQYIMTVLGDAAPADIISLGFDVIFSPDICKLMAKMFLRSGGESYGRIEKYHFNYNSTSATGDPVVLSGVAYFPNYPDNIEAPHTLDAFTIFHDYWKSINHNVSTDGAPIALRALYNEIVTIPDYEGYGITKEDAKYYKHAYFAYNELAQQSIDCALAGLELMEQLGIKMKFGYKTYNMGMSKGAPIALAAHKIIETKAPAGVRKKFDLAGTYCCSGPYDLRGLIEHYYNTENVTACWVATAIIYSVYISHAKIFNEYTQDTFFDSIFSEKFNDNKNKTELLQLFDSRHVWQEKLDEKFKSFGLTSFQELFNQNILDEGALNESNSLVKKLMEVLDDENPTLGWNPKAPVLFEQSIDDSFVPYEPIIASVEKFRNQYLIPNPLIYYNSYSGLDHSLISGLGYIKMGIFENPLLPIFFDPLSKYLINYALETLSSED